MIKTWNIRASSTFFLKPSRVWDSQTMPQPLMQNLSALLTAAGLVLTAGAGAAQASCTFLMPVGGGGQPVVEKRISPPGGVITRSNWNTDFAVNRSFASYRIHFQSASSEQAVFPVTAFLRFTDNTEFRLFTENITLKPMQRRTFGSFPAVPGRRTNQVNVRVGSASMPGAIGFSYRVSVEGCD